MNKTNKLTVWSLVFLCLSILCSCDKHRSVPADAARTEALPRLYPDYIDVTIPPNIAPLNFSVMEQLDDCIAQFSCAGKSMAFGNGRKVTIPEDEWAGMLTEAKGKDIEVEVFAHQGGQWKAFKPFKLHVAEEEIDPYISYRLIQPSYVAYNDLTIEQRNLSSYETSTIYDNTLIRKSEGGQCINCHSYQNYKTDNMMFHMRQTYGGTLVVTDGKAKKVDLKTDSTISAGVYPSWHPTEKLIAFSTNLTGQTFHTRSTAKVEVQDKESDLILYDVERDEVSTIANDLDEMEIFPCWSADGKALFYCSAHFEYQNDSIPHDTEILERYEDIRYNIYVKDFDPATRSFGERRLLFNADSLGLSATLPRTSPDGRYLVFSLGKFGCFHVWHADADICLLDLQTGEVRNLQGLNSERSESYPSFSSNGRWLMCASRRDDGNYTRPYIAYFDKAGQCYKAFELPQRDPNFYTFFLRSYNRPEFMTESVKISPEQFAAEVRKDAKKVVYKSVNTKTSSSKTSSSQTSSQTSSSQT